MSTTTSPIVGANGDVLAITAIRTQVVRLDGLTGELKSESCLPTHGDDPRLTQLIYADATGYVTDGLARYEQP